MARPNNLEHFLLNAYVSIADADDILTLCMVMDGADRWYEGNKQLAVNELFSSFYVVHGDRFSTDVIRLLLENDDEDFDGLYYALKILQSAPIAPAISEEVIRRLADVYEDVVFDSLCQTFIGHVDLAPIPADYLDMHASILRVHYTKAPSINAVLDRLRRIKAVSH